MRAQNNDLGSAGFRSGTDFRIEPRGFASHRQHCDNPGRVRAGRSSCGLKRITHPTLGMRHDNEREDPPEGSYPRSSAQLIKLLAHLGRRGIGNMVNHEVSSDLCQARNRCG